LRKRAEIRRQISTRKSVQEGKADRIADLLEEAANTISNLANDYLDQLEKPKIHTCSVIISSCVPCKKEAHMIEKLKELIGNKT
jgi:hypothetical protein